MTTEPARTPDLPADQDHAARIEHQDDVHVLVLTSDAPFERVRDDLRAMFAPGGPHAALRGETLRLDLGERDIVLFDLRRLTTLLAEEADVHVGGLVCGPEALHRYAEKQLKMRVHLSPAPAMEETPPVPEDAAASRADDEGGDASEAADGEAEDDAPAASTDSASTAGAATTDASSVSGSDEPTDPADPEAEPVALAADSAADADAADAGAAEADAADADSAEGDSPALSVVHSDPDRPAPPAALPEGGRRTVSVHRSLRSGAQVRFPGDIVIFGDVNPGAEVVADGSIVVLGALRGMAHAGAHGDLSATVMAFQLTPTNLRIAQRQALDLRSEATPRPGLLSLLRAPGLADRGAPRAATARVARVVDGAVVVDDYTARALR